MWEKVKIRERNVSFGTRGIGFDHQQDRAQIDKAERFQVSSMSVPNFNNDK